MRWLANLLLGPAAHFLLAGVLVLAFGCVAFTFSSQEDFEVGWLAVQCAGVLLLCGGIAFATAFTLAGRPERSEFWRTFLRWTLVAAIMVIPTGFLFGPAGGFHHMVGFGHPFFYMVWNGEDPDPGSFQIVKGYEVWFKPPLFLVLLATWGGILAFATSMVRPMRRSVNQ